ncbi:hypothetical protein Srufu_012960 [Streptomyces libani subsp. rufus]|nr:hypothetical protein Srufu_012960 [Streptomyces libani subsp. rufus]
MSLPRKPSGAAAAGASGGKGALRRIGEWCARHCVIVLVLWLVALAGLQFLQRTYGGEYSDDFALPGVQSTQGREVLQKHEPKAGATAARWCCTTRPSR